jgi:hypothetical protein
MAQILAIGGGGFQLEDAPSPIDDFVLAITRKSAEQRGRLHRAIEAGATSSAIAIDDHAAVLLDAGVVQRVVCWQPGATAYHLSMSDGMIHEHQYASEPIGL